MVCSRADAGDFHYGHTETERAQRRALSRLCDTRGGRGGKVCRVNRLCLLVGRWRSKSRAEPIRAEPSRGIGIVPLPTWRLSIQHPELCSSAGKNAPSRRALTEGLFLILVVSKRQTNAPTHGTSHPFSYAGCVAVGVRPGQSHNRFITGPTSSLAPTNNFESPQRLRTGQRSRSGSRKPTHASPQTERPRLGIVPTTFCTDERSAAKIKACRRGLWMWPCWRQMTFCLFVSQK